MSSAYFVEASVVEGPDEGLYKKIYKEHELGLALADFIRLVPVSEDAAIRYSM